MKNIAALIGVSTSLLFLCSCSSVPSEEDQKLLDKMTRENFYDKGLGTPAEYMTDCLGKKDIAIARRTLKGLDNGDKAEARMKLEALYGEAQKGFNWPFKTPPSVGIPYGTVKKIDGDTDDPDWRNAWTVYGEYPIDSVNRRSETWPIWRMMWDENYIYVSADIKDSSILAVHYDEAAQTGPWQGDCFEVFIMSEPGVKTYWELVLNPAGELFDAIHSNYRWGGYSNDPDRDMKGLQKIVRLYPDCSGYCVEMAIPFDQLPGYTKGNKPQAGELIRFMFVRLDDGAKFTPCPFLYDGHNIFGYYNATLVKK